MHGSVRIIAVNSIDFDGTSIFLIANTLFSIYPAFQFPLQYTPTVNLLLIKLCLNGSLSKIDIIHKLYIIVWISVYGTIESCGIFLFALLLLLFRV